MRGGAFCSDVARSKFSANWGSTTYPNYDAYTKSPTAFVAYEKDNPGLFNKESNYYKDRIFPKDMVIPNLETTKYREWKNPITVIVTLPDGQKTSRHGKVEHQYDGFIIIDKDLYPPGIK